MLVDPTPDMHIWHMLNSVYFIISHPHQSQAATPQIEINNLIHLSLAGDTNSLNNTVLGV